MFTTLLQNVYSNDVDKYINTIVKEQYTAKAPSLITKNGGILFKMPINKTSVDNMINSSLSVLPRISSMQFHSNVTNKIIQIKNVTNFTRAMEIIETYRNVAPQLFYGALLKLQNEKETFINPYHVLSASCIIDNGYDNSNFISETFDILIYFMDTNSDTTKLFCEKPSAEIQAAMKTNIDSILLQYQNKLESVNKVIKTIPSGSLSSFKLVYKTKIFPDENPEFSSYIVPSAILTKGIVAPFYGTNLIKIFMDGKITKGMSVSPFKTCNISNTDDYNASFTNVCTGSTSNKTHDGLLTLHHVNLNSPFGDSKQGIPAYGKFYIDEMIQTSLKLYKIKGFVI